MSTRDADDTRSLLAAWGDQSLAFLPQTAKLEIQYFSQCLVPRRKPENTEFKRSFVTV